MTTLEIIQSAKRAARSPVFDESALQTEVDTALPKAFWMQALRDSIQFHQNLINQKMQDFFVGEDTISFVSGTREYTIPSKSITVRHIERTDVSPDEVVHPISIGHRKEIDDDYPHSTKYRQPDDDFAYLWGPSTMGFGELPDSSETDNINILYIRRLPDPIYDILTGTPTTTSFIPSEATNYPSFGSLSEIDDYYNHARVRIISGTGIGQTRKITDYVASTRTFTVSPAFAPAPVAASVIDIVLDIPAEHHEAVYTGMALAALRRDRADTRDLARHHSILIDTMLKGVANRFKADSLEGVRNNDL